MGGVDVIKRRSLVCCGTTAVLEPPKTAHSCIMPL
jgi:hypothetical protein